MLVPLDFAADFALLVAAGFSKSAAVKCGVVVEALTVGRFDPAKLPPLVMPVVLPLLGRKASVLDPLTEDDPVAPRTTPLPNAAPLAIIARDPPPKLEVADETDSLLVARIDSPRGGALPELLMVVSSPFKMRVVTDASMLTRGPSFLTAPAPTKKMAKRRNAYSTVLVPRVSAASFDDHMT